MNFIETIISIAIIGILGVSLIVTWSVGRRQKVADGEFDVKIGEPVKKNVYSRNPVFLAYVIFFALLLAIILFVKITFF
jgi:hypothetical protein